MRYGAASARSDMDLIILVSFTYIIELFPIYVDQDKSRPLGFDPMDKTKFPSDYLGQIVYLTY